MDRSPPTLRCRCTYYQMYTLLLQSDDDEFALVDEVQQQAAVAFAPLVCVRSEYHDIALSRAPFCIQLQSVCNGSVMVPTYRIPLPRRSTPVCQPSWLNLPSPAHARRRQLLLGVVSRRELLNLLSTRLSEHSNRRSSNDGLMGNLKVPSGAILRQ